MTLRYLLLLPPLAFLSACSSSSGSDTPDTAGDAGSHDAVVPDAPASDGAPADAPSDTDGTSTFLAEPEPEDASLFVTADVSDPEAPIIEVRAKQLGSVFGIAFHVHFDATLLSVESPAVQPFLGPDAEQEARYLLVARPGDVAVGGARSGPDVGEIDISTTVVLATIPLQTKGTGSADVRITEAQVRRADGSVAQLEVAGGVLNVGGAS